MDGDCGVLVVSRRGKLLAANPLAESFLARPLPSGSFLKANGPLAHSFSRHGYPIWERLSCGEEEHGLLQLDDLAGMGLFYRCIPLYSEENRVTGTVITLEKRGDEAGREPRRDHGAVSGGGVFSQHPVASQLF